MAWSKTGREQAGIRNNIAPAVLFSVVVCLLVGLSSTAAHADVLMYEPFDYASASTLGGQGDATSSIGFGSNTWISRSGGSVVGGTIGAGLTYNDGTNDLQTSGGHYTHARLSGSSSLYAVHRKLDVGAISTSNPDVTFEDTTTYTPGHHIGKDGSTVWFSFIYQSAWDGSTNGGGAANWGGVTFDDGDALQNGGTTGGGTPFVSLPADPTDPDFPTEVRTLRPFDTRGDMGGEKAFAQEQEFSLTAHRGTTLYDESGGPLVNASPPTFVLMRMDFQGDPSAPNGANEYYETWPKADQADQIRLWLNPSLTSEPATGTENLLLNYESEFGREFTPDGGVSEFHLYADRFDFKIDGISMNARADGTLYDELRMGTTFGDVTPIVGGAPDVDLDDDNDVDGADFLAIQRTDPSLISEWQNQYGVGTLVAASSVPEPTTLVLSLLSFAGLVVGRRSRS